MTRPGTGLASVRISSRQVVQLTCLDFLFTNRVNVLAAVDVVRTAAERDYYATQVVRS